MRVKPSPRNFGFGELSPRLDGIANEVTARGCRTLENWIVGKRGEAIRRPGTFHVQGAISTTVAQNEWGPGERIVPLTPDEAVEWCERTHNFTAEEKHFPHLVEDA